jgi:HEAT repeat protein
VEQAEDGRHRGPGGLATLGRLGALADSALLAAWAEAGWDSDDEFTNHRLPCPLIDACEQLGPRSRLVGPIVKAMDTSTYHVPERARDVLCRFGVEAFEVVLDQGSRLRRGKGHVGEVLRSYPDAGERLLAVAKDRQRPGRQRGCAVAALVPPGWEHGPEHDWLVPHLIGLLDEPDPEVLREAVWALRGFKERAAGAAPALVRLLGPHDDLLPYSVLAVLEGLGPQAAQAALPAVRQLFEHHHPTVQAAAKRFVGSFADPSDLVREVRVALRAKEVGRRKEAVRRLCARPEQFPDLLDLLRQALADPSEDVRHAAVAEGVRVKWPEGTDPSPFFREALAELLRRLGAERSAGARAGVVRLLAEKALRGPEALAATCAALGDEEAVRHAALQVLRDDWRPLPAEAIPGLLHLVRTTPGYQGREAALLLQYVRPCSNDLLGALRERLRLAPPDTGFLALEVLERLGHIPTDDEVPFLVSALAGAPGGFEVSGAARLLARRGAPALPHLIGHLAQANGSAVARALATMGPVARTALPALGELVHHEWGFVRSTAVEAIAAIGTPAEVVPLLRPAFRDRNGHVRGTVLRVCARLGPAARPWLPGLMHLVRTEEASDELRGGELAPVLAGLAADDPEVFAQLRQALSEPGAARANAAGALAEMGARAAEAVPELEALLAHAGPGERPALAEALRRIQSGPEA